MLSQKQLIRPVPELSTLSSSPSSSKEARNKPSTYGHGTLCNNLLLPRQLPRQTGLVTAHPLPIPPQTIMKLT